MKIADLKIGDCVQLASGGPKMTVMDLTSLGRVIVTWQMPDGQRGQDILTVDVLIAVK